MKSIEKLSIHRMVHYFVMVTLDETSIGETCGASRDLTHPLTHCSSQTYGMLKEKM